MSMERLILQMGMGLDAGGDVQAAAGRAVADAQNRTVVHVSQDTAEMRLTLGVPGAVALDPAPLVAALGDSGCAVTVVEGGLASGASVVVTAAVERFMPITDGAQT